MSKTVHHEFLTANAFFGIFDGNKSGTSPFIPKVPMQTPTTRIRAKAPKPLNNTFIKNAKFSGMTKGDKYADGAGLYLFVTATGKHWRLDYALHGKRKTYTFGTYPLLSLAEARQRRDDIKRLINEGIDPTRAKHDYARARHEAAANVFERVSEAWLKLNQTQRGPKTLKKLKAWLDKDVNPHIGSIPVKDLTASDVLNVVRRVEARGARDSARRILLICRQVLSFAVGESMVVHNVAAHLNDNLAPVESNNYAAIIDPTRFAALLRAIDGYQGHASTRTALKMAPLVFVRPGELRQAEWSEINLETATWEIPPAKMKMKRSHVVPLSKQVVALLQDMHQLTGHGRYVFPSIRTDQKPMSDNTLNAALRALGYDRTVMVAHGFRASARTIMVEVCGVNRDLVELQLAHTTKDSNGTAYDRTTFLPARRKMMDDWANYLDAAKEQPANPRRSQSRTLLMTVQQSAALHMS